MERQESDGVTTPPSRQNYDMASLSNLDKQRVKKADPNGGRCLVMNAKAPLNYCHCISRQTMKDDAIVRVYRIHRYLL